MPGSVQSLVQARMDQLDPFDRQALQTAAIFGQRFALDALRHALERPDYDCAPLVEHFLVRPIGDDFLFAHALIRDAVYDTLLRPRRRELHRRAADWFAARDLVLRAEHLDRAEHPEAAQAYLEAARAQAADYRYERARALTERGLALAIDPADSLRAHLPARRDPPRPRSDGRIASRLRAGARGRRETIASGLRHGSGSRR